MDGVAHDVHQCWHQCAGDAVRQVLVVLPAGWLPSAPHLEPAMVGAASAVVAALASVKLTAFAFYVFPATLGELGPHEAGYACELLGLG